MKYFCSYAVGGCLMAIALSAFLTEIARLVPALTTGLLVFWGVVAVVSGVVIRLSETVKTFGHIWLWSNLLIGMGVCFGIA